MRIEVEDPASDIAVRDEHILPAAVDAVRDRKRYLGVAKGAVRMACPDNHGTVRSSDLARRLHPFVELRLTEHADTDRVNDQIPALQA